MHAGASETLWILETREGWCLVHTGSCPTCFSQNLLSEPSFLPSLSGGDSIRDLKDPCQKRKGDRPGSTHQPVPFLTKPWAQPLQPTAPTGMRPLTTQVPQLCHPGPHGLALAFTVSKFMRKQRLFSSS